MTRHEHVVPASAEPFRPGSRLAPVHSGGVIAQTDGGGGTDCQWLRAAAEMAGMASGNWPLPPSPGPPGQKCSPAIATRAQYMDATAVRAGREFSIATLRRWGVTQRREDIVTVVSELLTNALRHAVPGLGHNRWPGWPVRLGLLRSTPCMLCAVADPSSSVPVLKNPGHLSENGRGLHVVCSLCDRWGYTTYTTPSEMGKVVWAMFMTPPGAAIPPTPGATR